MSRLVRINLGSGQRKFNGWVNIDINPRWEPDYVADGAHLPMFGDNEVDMIVAHHTLEHYGCGEGSGMLQECHRILKPGGSLIITVPDMHALCHAWLTGKMGTQLFMTNTYGAFMDSEADRHRWGYDWHSLQTFVKSTAAWSHVYKFDFRWIQGADIAGPEWWILGAEAIK